LFEGAEAPGLLILILFPDAAVWVILPVQAQRINTFFYPAVFGVIAVGDVFVNLERAFLNVYLFNMLVVGAIPAYGRKHLSVQFKKFYIAGKNVSMTTGFSTGDYATFYGCDFLCTFGKAINEIALNVSAMKGLFFYLHFDLILFFENELSFCSRSSSVPQDFSNFSNSSNTLPSR
jgi:hypothetical protein